MIDSFILVKYQNHIQMFVMKAYFDILQGNTDNVLRKTYDENEEIIILTVRGKRNKLWWHLQ